MVKRFYTPKKVISLPAHTPVKLMLSAQRIESVQLANLAGKLLAERRASGERQSVEPLGGERGVQVRRLDGPRVGVALEVDRSRPARDGLLIPAS